MQATQYTKLGFQIVDRARPKSNFSNTLDAFNGSNPWPTTLKQWVMLLEIIYCTNTHQHRPQVIIN
jgi:hypothetical protein